MHWIASATKFITSIAVMQCVESGLLDLDADISCILPEWKHPKILIGFNEKDEPQFRPAKRPLTLRYAALDITLHKFPVAKPRFYKTSPDAFRWTSLHLHASAGGSLPGTSRRATSIAADNCMSIHCQILTHFINKFVKRGNHSPRFWYLSLENNGYTVLDSSGLD